MAPPSVPRVERAFALFILGFAVMGIAWSIQEQVGWAEAKSEPVPQADEGAAAVASLPHRLLFPLPGFEHALRDNFEEKRGTRRHQALDIMAPRGTPVCAVEDGRIAKLYRGPLAGIAVYQFDAAMTRVYFYAHLDRHAEGLVEGKAVARGEVIGYVGSTGNAPESAPHLHFAMHELGPDRRWWRGKAMNPYDLLKPPPAQ